MTQKFRLVGQVTYFVLILLIGLGLLARFYRLDQVVTILNRDEAALAYNAYLLKAKGVDEWGASWPLVLQSFGDWKLIGYPMILVGLFHFLPLADWVVRLPSALAGVGLVGLSYLYAKRVFYWPRRLSLFFAALVATAPFGLFYSRFAYEANVALFYLLLALFLLWLATKNLKKRYLLDLGASFVLLLAIFTYNTPFLLLPFLVGFVLLCRDLLQPKTYLPAIASLASVFLIGLWRLWPVLIGKNEITIFSDPKVFFQFAQFRESLANPIMQKLVGNHYIYLLFLMIKNTLMSFRPDFLSFTPFHPWHAVPGTGQIYFSVYLLSLAGISLASYILLRSILNQLKSRIWLKSLLNWLKLNLVLPAKVELLLLYLLIISLAPAVVTTDAPHATRSLLFLFILLVFTVYLVNFVDQKLNQIKRVWWLLLLSLVLTFEFFHYLPKLFFQYHQDQVTIYQAGFDQAIKKIEQDYPTRSVAVVDPGGYQYILLAWYLKLDPDFYLTHNVRQQPDSVGLRYGERVGRYHFIVHADDRHDEQLLLYWEKSKARWRVVGGS